MKMCDVEVREHDTEMSPPKGGCDNVDEERRENSDKVVDNLPGDMASQYHAIETAMNREQMFSCPLYSAPYPFLYCIPVPSFHLRS